MTSHPPESRLIDLASGLLTAEEAREILQHVRQCPECEKRLQALAADRESARSGPVPVLRNGRIQLARPQRMGSRILIRSGVLAASLAIVAFGVFLLTHHDSTPDYWIPITKEPTVLRSPEETDTLKGFAHGLQAYQNRDAEEAVKQLEAFKPPAGDITAPILRDLYLASALVNANRPEEALDILSKLHVDWLPTQWRFHAQWVQYIALVRAGRNEDAKAWLEKLSNEPGEIGEKAREELKRSY